MSLIEKKEIDKIEIVSFGVLQVRETTTIMRDGEEVAKTYHRWSFEPGSDISIMPTNIQAIAAVVWTPEVVDTFRAMIAAQQAKMGAQA
jgi:hypothetical protein